MHIMENSERREAVIVSRSPGEEVVRTMSYMERRRKPCLPSIVEQTARC
jgi:hypothetical protein